MPTSNFIPVSLLANRRKSHVLAAVTLPGHSLDWSNCCVYNLSSDRGEIIQPPPLWPMACTASYYAAVSARRIVTTADYTVNGPHFFDFQCLAERGCRSMAAVPMSSCSQPVAVLCLASDQVRRQAS